MSLKISVQDGRTCEKILKIEVPQEKITQEFETYYKAIAPRAAVPGFRPGKVPRNILALHYAADAREKVLKSLLTESYREAVREKSLQPLGFPEIENVHFDDSKLSFDAKIEIRPRIKSLKTKGFKVRKEEEVLKPEEIEETLKKIQESLAKFKAVEDRPAQLGDFLTADYECFVNEKSIEKRKDDWMELRKDDFLEGFSEQLVGAKPGDEREVRTQFPEKYGNKDLAGKPALFKVKVKEIKVKELPILDDELAREAGDFQSLDQLKEKIQKDLLAEKKREVEMKYQKALLEELIKQNKADLPEGLIQRRYEHLMEDAVNNFLQRGVPASKVEELKEKMKKDFEVEARRQVHLAFLLDEIAEQEKLEASAEDLKQKYQQLAEEHRQPVEVVEKYYTEHPDGVQALQDQIRNEKAIEFVKRSAKE